MRVTRVTCPGCGANLEEVDDSSLTRCPHCGTTLALDQQKQTSFRVHLELGQTNLQAGNYGEANFHFSRALEKRHHSGEAWFWKAITAAMQGEVEEGDTYWRRSGFTQKQTCERLLRLMAEQGEDSAKRLIESAAHVDQGRWHWAEIFLETALRLAPGLKGRVAGWIEEATEYEAVRGQYQGSGYILVAAYAGAHREFDRAASYLRRSLEIEPDAHEEVAKGYIELAHQTAEVETVPFLQSPDGQGPAKLRGAMPHEATIYLESALRTSQTAKKPVAQEYFSMGEHWASEHQRQDLNKAAYFFERSLEINPGLREKVAERYLQLARKAAATESDTSPEDYAERATALDPSVQAEAMEVAERYGERPVDTTQPELPSKKGVSCTKVVVVAILVVAYATCLIALVLFARQRQRKEGSRPLAVLHVTRHEYVASNRTFDWSRRRSATASVRHLPLSSYGVTKPQIPQKAELPQGPRMTRSDG